AMSRERSLASRLARETHGLKVTSKEVAWGTDEKASAPPTRISGRCSSRRENERHDILSEPRRSLPDRAPTSGLHPGCLCHDSGASAVDAHTLVWGHPRPHYTQRN